MNRRGSLLLECGFLCWKFGWKLEVSQFEMCPDFLIASALFSIQRFTALLIVVCIVASVTINQTFAGSPAVVPSPANIITSIEAETFSKYLTPSIDPALVGLQFFIQDRLIVKWLATGKELDIPWNTSHSLPSRTPLIAAAEARKRKVSVIAPCRMVNILNTTTAQ